MFLEDLLVSSPFPTIWRRNSYVHYYILQYTGEMSILLAGKIGVKLKNSRFHSFFFQSGFSGTLPQCVLSRAPLSWTASEILESRCNTDWG